ncbi:putative multidrug efflux transporter [Bdellovibrio bacteriovorus W]|nr:putative multidrug efflux transporter [Bdellovibrio bacteriovorus W]
MAYAYLAAAILFEVLGTITMKYSEGFTKVVPVILTLVCHGICFVALAVALKSLPVSMVYAVWAGIGTAAMAFVGLMIFNEPLPIQKVLATSLIVLGVVLLSLSPDKDKNEAQNVVKAEATQKANVLDDADVAAAILAQRNSG